jgi:rubrerythrin
MSNSPVAQLLTMAIDREADAHDFYAQAASRMKNPAIRDAFAKLAEEELCHKRFLETCTKDPQLLSKLPLPADFKVAEATAEQELSIDMTPAQAMTVAMKKEQQAVEFYRCLAAQAKDPSYRQALEGLARMELDHKNRLETMFVEVGYPESF